MEFPPFRKDEQTYTELQMQKHFNLLFEDYKKDNEKNPQKILIIKYSEEYEKKEENLFKFGTIEELCIDFPKSEVFNKCEKTLNEKIPQMIFPKLKDLYMNFNFKITDEVNGKDFFNFIKTLLKFATSETNQEINFHLKLNCRINIKQNSSNFSSIIKEIQNIKLVELIIIDDIFYNFSFQNFYSHLFPEGEIEKLHIKNFKFVKDERIHFFFEFLSSHKIQELIMENVFIEIIENSVFLTHYFTLQENSEKSCYYLSEIEVNENQTENNYKTFDSISKITLIDTPLMYFQNVENIFTYSIHKNLTQTEGITYLNIDRNSMLNYPMKMQKIKIENNEITTTFDGDIETDYDSEDSYITCDHVKCKYEFIGHIINSKGKFKKICFKNLFIENDNDPLFTYLPDSMIIDNKIEIREITFNQCSNFFVNKFTSTILDLEKVEKIKIKNIVIKDYKNSSPVFPNVEIKRDTKVNLIIKNSIVNLGENWKKWLQAEGEPSNDNVIYDRDYSEKDNINFKKEFT